MHCDVGGEPGWVVIARTRHEDIHVATESPWRGSRCVLNQDITPPWRSFAPKFEPKSVHICTLNCPGYSG